MKKFIKLWVAIPIFVAVIGLQFNAYAVSAYPYPGDFINPDGSVITIQMHGSPWHNWRTTEDEFTLIFNNDGFLEYAVQDEYGDLQPSGIRARNVRERTDQERDLLRRTPRNLRFSDGQRDLLRQARGIYDALEEEFEIWAAPTSGTVRVPIILVDFPDRPFRVTRQAFYNMFNQVGYNEASRPGSLRDYFLAMSYGALDLRVGVYGPVRMPQTIWHYDHNNTENPQRSGAGGRMARLAVEGAARDHGLNFANYPAPGNTGTGGDAIAVHIIFAGHGQEARAPVVQSIWSHASSFSALTLNGRRVNRYSCSPEFRSNSGTNMSGIGIVAHELGHSVLRLPDTYDTNGDTDGRAVDLGRWCLMASGNWAGNGDRPTNLSAELRMMVGWADVVELTTAQAITIPCPSTMSNGVVYRIRTTTTNEYFLLENRQRNAAAGHVAWDNGIPASGLLIYHVDRAGVSWTGNRVVANAARRGVYIKQAGGDVGSTSTNRATDPWPQTVGGVLRNSFTDTSVPNSRSWAGANTNRPITNITHNTTTRSVSFNFMGGTSQAVAPQITTQPANRTVNVGQTAQFSVVASGTAPLTFQWQVRPNGSTTWTNVSATHGTGGTTASFTTVAATAAMSGNSYRITVSNSAGVVTSSVATLTANNPVIIPSISTQPASRTVQVGQTAQFSVVASGTAPLTFQWQVRPSGSTTWTDVSATHGTGGTTASFTTVATTAEMSGNRYRVIVRNSAGSVNSSSATLTVNRAAGATVPAPTMASRTHNSITLNQIANATNGQAIEYARSTTNTAPTTGWQASREFLSLTSCENYFFFARTAQNAGFNAGIASGGTLIRTDHNFSVWTAWDTTEVATCFEDGSRSRTRLCSVCDAEGAVDTRAIPQLGEEECGSSFIRGRLEALSSYGILLDPAIASDIANISVKTPEPTQIKIRISDNLGNVVFETSGRSTDTFVWNLTNHAGRFVANATYLIVVEATSISGRRFTYSARMGVSR